MAASRVRRYLMRRLPRGGGAAVTAPTNIVAPALSAAPVVGVSLSCSAGTWIGTTPISYAYQWRLAGVDIGGATSSSYTPLVGQALSCRVTASNASGTPVSATSAGQAVAATQAPQNASDITTFTLSDPAGDTRSVVIYKYGAGTLTIPGLTTQGQAASLTGKGRVILTSDPLTADSPWVAVESGAV